MGLVLYSVRQLNQHHEDDFYQYNEDDFYQYNEDDFSIKILIFNKLSTNYKFI